MTLKTGGKKIVTGIGSVMMALALMTGAEAWAGSTNMAGHAPAVERQQMSQPVAFVKDVIIAAIDVANHAARSTSDTVHHNAGNVMNTVAKARGFVRDTVSGVLGNARKLSGMVGDVMPFTEHNHYESVPARKDAE